MRFHALATDSDGAMTGVATNDRRDRARRFCDAYRAASLRMLAPETLRLEPAVWSGSAGGATAGDGEDLRFHFSAEEEPGLFEAVFDCLGHEPSAFDVVVLMREDMLAHPSDIASILAVVIQDAASVLADEADEAREIGWAAPDVRRAAIAAVLLRSVEWLMPSPAAVEAAYREICACALAGLVRGRARYARQGGEIVFVRENPGLVTVIDRAVARARAAATMPLPLDADEVLDAAEANLRAALDTAADHLQLA